MTFTAAAAQVLRLVGKPLHYKEITDVAIEKNLLSHVGKSPEVTMGARLAALVKKSDKDNPLVRVKPGVFALREWDTETIAVGLADRTPALERLAAAMAAAGEVLVDVEESGEPSPAVAAAMAAAASTGEQEPGDDEVLIGNEDDRRRAELAAGATELFSAEEDDDKPIFGAEDVEEEEEEGDRDAGGRRRGRRRRKRGRGPEDARGADDLPSYTVSEPSTEQLKVADAEIRARESRSDVSHGEPARESREPREGREPRESREGREPRELREPRDGRDYREGREEGRMGLSTAGREGRTDGNLQDRARQSLQPIEELVGRDLADALAQLLSGYDRNAGPVPYVRLAEAAKRRGRLGVDTAQGQVLLEAAARAENLRRQIQGQRPRFRLGDRRVALIEWGVDSETQRVERELYAVVERYREHSRRALLRKLQELPQRSFGELILLLLERIGFSELVPVRRPGTHGAELHLSGKLLSAAGEIRTAVVLRRDGREIGRERVTELRGALHHYGPANAGWLITSGQVLSGAKEEANAPGAAPVNLLDGIGLAKLMEEQGIGVTRLTLSLPVADLELFDALKSGS
ncbi:MAG TPA: HTH domain-containing protein [Polyangiaceae bacterium]|nr:HTH domain-containing protein [Polyangiaceae bacterium]